MALSDWIGTLGVVLLLLAFALNIAKRITAESTLYLSLNIIGAGLTCISSYMIRFWPFVVLEAVWVIASIFALLRSYSHETK